MNNYAWNKPGDDERREYIGKACKLNGKPAKIVHIGDGWPGVAALDGLYPPVPFSWTAIYNVMENRGGDFSVA